GEIGAGEPAGCTGRVPLRDVLGVHPAGRRERDDARIEPDVADLGDALDPLAAARAGDRDAVDPRAAELLEPLEALERALAQLVLRADHVQLAARARIERERQ